MTNFIYNMQDEIFHLPIEDFSTIKKLVDHIEAQGKQLRELNKGITKKNATIKKYEREKKDLQERNSCLCKKVVELNNGIRNSEDLTWKQKYEALLHSSEQAIGALQKKCQEYKNSESDAITNTIEALVRENKELKEEVNLYIGVTNTKNEEVEALAKAVRCPWGNNAEIISAKTARIKELEEKNKKLERANLDLGDTIGWYVEEFKKLKEDLEKEKQVSKDLNDEIKKLKYDNDTLRGRAKEISYLAEKRRSDYIMTAEQKDRMKYEVEVQKARELKRIVDALEIISGLKCPKELGFDFERHEPLQADMLKMLKD